MEENGFEDTELGKYACTAQGFVFPKAQQEFDNCLLSDKEKRKRESDRNMERLNSTINRMIDHWETQDAERNSQTQQEKAIMMLAELPQVETGSPFWVNCCKLMLDPHVLHLFLAQHRVTKDAQFAFLRSLVHDRFGHDS